MPDKNTILIVENDVRLRFAVTDYLKISNFDVLYAENGPEALKIFSENPETIDIVLLDGMLPLHDGLEVLKKIQETSDIPVIIISASQSETEQLKCFYAGADNYITNPFPLSELREQQVNALLNKASDRVKFIECGAIIIDLKLRRVYIDG